MIIEYIENNLNEWSEVWNQHSFIEKIKIINQYAIFLPLSTIVIEHTLCAEYPSGVRNTFLKHIEMVLSSQSLYSRKYKIIFHQSSAIYTFIPNYILLVNFESRHNYMI